MSVWMVTGASGFLGRHVLGRLQDVATSEDRVFAVGRRRPPDCALVTWSYVDLTSAEAVRAVVESISPDVVIHLAGRTPPAPAGEMYLANAVATALLLDALAGRGRPVRVVMAGSAAELGAVAEADLPVGESHPCRPEAEYGRSKWLATLAGLAARAPVEVVVARLFNPIGPGMPATQALGRFACELADPGTHRLAVGRLDSRRDFVDVRDAAEAFLDLARRGRPGQVYHVGTGTSRPVGDGLAHLIRLRGDPVAIDSTTGPAAGAWPSDSRADIRKIAADTGWRPRIPWEQSLSDLWEGARRGHGCH